MRGARTAGDDERREDLVLGHLAERAARAAGARQAAAQERREREPYAHPECEHLRDGSRVNE